MKIYIIYLALCSLVQAIYYSPISPINRMSTVTRKRTPAVFRPGISIQGLQSVQRPWFGAMRLAPQMAQRAPYILYRNPPQRYSLKHYAPSSTKNILTQSPWKTSMRLPSISIPEYEFVKAASAQTVVHNDGGTGAIHTIPAPNLSLQEKPIVVSEGTEKPKSEPVKPSYEVTEKYAEGEHVVKIEAPVDVPKENTYPSPEVQNLLRNGAALQLAAEYALPAFSVNQHHTLTPQEFQVPALPSHQDVFNHGPQGLYIPPSALYQDPMFLTKLQNQILHRYPALEFVPYGANIQSQVHLQPQPYTSEHRPQVVLLQNEQLDGPLSGYIPEKSEEKNVVQRETQETSAVTLIPEATVANKTENQIEVTTIPQQPTNITVELVAAESRPVTTTIKYIIEKNNGEQITTPIYYAQVGQSVGNAIASGFYTAINDVRAAAVMAQMDEVPETTPAKPRDDITTTTASVLNTYFVKNEEKSENKTELKPLLGTPFKKATDSVKVAYTLVKAEENEPKPTQERTVYAGQIVEATISEDQDFNKAKTKIIARRAPIRLFAVADTKNIASATKVAIQPEVAVVKARIPPKSKITFDEKTGEPVLRIYASYDDTTAQKESVIAKLATANPVKNGVKRDLVKSWKGTTVNTADKTQGFDANQVTEFGLKLKHRSDDYIALFDDYED